MEHRFGRHKRFSDRSDGDQNDGNYNTYRRGGWRARGRGGSGRGRGGGGRGRGGGGRHPEGLRGREIGLWYARQGGAKKRESERLERGEVKMDGDRERHISQLLHQIRTSDAVETQPSTSYRNIDDDWEDAQNSADAQPPKESRDFFRIDKTGCRSFEMGSCDFAGASAMDVSDDDIDGADGDDDDGDDDSGEEVPKVTDLYHYNEERQDVAIDYIPLGQLGHSAHDSDYSLLQDVPRLNEEYLNELTQKKSDAHYRDVRVFRKKLPSYGMRDKIVEVIESNQVTVISGETGCGKTTQVTQFILDHYIQANKGSLCHVVCTQPRRISAVSVAERIADERSEPCGRSVGYQIRLENKLPRQQGSILYCTTGILIKCLQGDPLLSKTSHVILDEIHERNLLSDFLIIILRDLLPRRPDLKLVLMSATLNADKFSEYFGGCPIVHIPGFTFPVEKYFMEDIVEMIDYHPQGDALKPTRPKFKRFGLSRKEQLDQYREYQVSFSDWLESQRSNYSNYTLDTLSRMNLDEIDITLIIELIKHIVLTKEDGAILVFLPGWDLISKLHKQLMALPMFNSSKFLLLPLHSLMPTVNQRAIFNRPPPGVRKVVIATNIAETSITIDDVVYVIDCGKIKLKNFDASSNISTLLPEWVSKANAKQRSGRAGRVQPGQCYHLYTRFQDSQLDDYQLPEMLRTRLEELCLQIKILKLGRILPFVQKAMEPPSMTALECAIRMLEDLSALDADEELTPLGFHLAKMPMDPQVGKMILFGAMFSCLDPILTVAASLSFKDAFTVPLGKEKLVDMRKRDLSRGSRSDHIMLVNAFSGWERARGRGTSRQYCWDNFMSEETLRLLSQMKKQLAELLHELGFLSNSDVKGRDSNLHSDNLSLVKAIICAGLYPNVAKIQTNLKETARVVKLYSKENSGKIEFHPKSVNSSERQFDSKWVVYHLKMRTSGVYLYDSTMVSPYPLLFFGGNITTSRDEYGHWVSVDDWITFKASPRIAGLVKELGLELDKLLEFKITHTGVTDWNPRTKEGALMTAILDLITTEDRESRDK